MAQLPPKPVDLDRAESAIRELLLALGQGDKEEVMANTPRRVAEMYQEFINPPYVDVEAELKTFPNGHGEQLVMVEGVHYVSICEHHLAPAFGVATLAYVPDELVVGYSKLKKGLNYLARQPQLNERLLTDTLDFVASRLAPKGIALATRSVHCCIALRANAPMQEIVTITQGRGCLGPGGEQSYLDHFRACVYASKPIFLGA